MPAGPNPAPESYAKVTIPYGSITLWVNQCGCSGVPVAQPTEFLGVHVKHSTSTGRRLGRLVLIIGAYVFGALFLVVVGEALFRGGKAALQWCMAMPMAAVCSAFIVLLCQLGLETVFTRRVAFSCVALVYWSFSLADRAKFSKLGTPAMPTDLLLSGQYSKLAFMLWGAKWIWIAVACALAVTAIVIGLRRRGIRFVSFSGATALGKVLRLSCLAFVVFLVVGPDYNFKNARFRHSVVASLLDDWGVSNLNWSPATNVMTNGQLLAFLMNAKSVLAHRPAGYGEALIASALGKSPRGEVLADSANPRPDVVVIMSEALWDPTALPKVRFSDPLLERLDYAKRGTLFSPVFGGYTANTEFEFLTRLSNAYLPVGSIPYMQYVNRPLNSLAQDFASRGYQATALHPFDGHFWNRNDVYPKLGFGRFIDGSGFQWQEKTPPYISDASMAKQIIATAEQGAAPHFIFTVSVQNHGPYLDGESRYKLEPRVEVFDDGGRMTPAAKDILSTYASGVRDAARSFDAVVEFYRRSGRPAVVMMFGDHLPFLGDDFLVYRQVGYVSTANQSQWSSAEQERMHGTPILVWSNVPEPSALPTASISPIYLGTVLKRLAGIPDNRFDVLLERLEEQYPVVSQFYSRSSHGQVYEGAPKQNGVATDYAAMVYDELFGDNYSAKLLDVRDEVTAEKRSRTAP